MIDRSEVPGVPGPDLPGGLCGGRCGVRVETPPSNSRQGPGLRKCFNGSNKWFDRLEVELQFTSYVPPEWTP